jgi:hypothetical protein
LTPIRDEEKKFYGIAPLRCGEVTRYGRVFAPGKPFQPCIMFASECFSDKLSSLFFPISDEGKSFIILFLVLILNFFFVTDKETKYAKVFDTGKPFQPSLTLAIK